MTIDLLDALLTLPDMLSARISPDGRWAAWSWLGVGATADVYAAPTDGSQPPVKLTESDENVFLTSWTPDSRAVLVAQDHDGDERYRLFRVDLDQPGVMQPLTEATPNYFLRGGDLHPNGRWLVYGANVDESGQEIEPTWIYRHDLETGERTPLARPHRTGFMRVRLSPDGQHVIYYRKERGRSGLQLWLVGIDGGSDREIVNAGDDRKVFGSWLPDSSGVIVLAETATHTRVGIWSLSDGALRWLVDDPARNVEDAYVPFGSDQAVIVEVDQARTCPSLVDLASGVETRLPAARGDLQPLAPTPDGAWIGRYSSSQQPADLVRFTPGDCAGAVREPHARLGAHAAHARRLRPGGGLPLEVR